MTGKRMSGNLLRPGLRRSHENGEALIEVGQVGEKTVFFGDEEGAIQDM
jgi:hypothetical protein